MKKKLYLFLAFLLAIAIAYGGGYLTRHQAAVQTAAVHDEAITAVNDELSTVKAERDAITAQRELVTMLSQLYVAELDIGDENYGLARTRIAKVAERLGASSHDGASDMKDRLERFVGTLGNPETVNTAQLRRIAESLDELVTK